MKKLIQIGILLCLVSSAAAQDQILPLNGSTAEKIMHVCDWNDLLPQHPFPQGEIISQDGMTVLKISNTNDVPLEVTILTITNSSLLRNVKSASIEVKYELRNDRPLVTTNRDGIVERGKQYLSANLAFRLQIPSEVLGGDETTGGYSYPLAGTSNWQRLYSGTPYFARRTPTQIELRLLLDGSGTVYLRPLKLIGVPQNWWSPQTAGLIGGIGGSLIGCFGGLIGILASMGKGRRFVLATTVILIVTGILLVIAGVVAVAMKQPYAVWYPLLLGGTILTFVLSINLYSIKRRYDDLEIRRMTSMDATGR